MAFAVKKAAAPKKPAAKKTVAKKASAHTQRKQPGNSHATSTTITLSDIYPDEDSRLTFLRGCVCLAQSDGAIDDSEKAFFLNASIGMGISPERQEEVAEWLNVEQNEFEVMFDNKRQALFFLREALQMCYLDGHFSDSERTCLTNICQRAGVCRASFEYVEDWVREGMEWRREGDNLLSLEG